MVDLIRVMENQCIILLLQEEYISKSSTTRTIWSSERRSADTMFLFLKTLIIIYCVIYVTVFWPLISNKKAKIKLMLQLVGFWFYEISMHFTLHLNIPHYQIQGNLVLSSSNLRISIKINSKNSLIKSPFFQLKRKAYNLSMYAILVSTN